MCWFGHHLCAPREIVLWQGFPCLLLFTQVNWFSLVINYRWRRWFSDICNFVSTLFATSLSCFRYLWLLLMIKKKDRGSAGINLISELNFFQHYGIHMMFLFDSSSSTVMGYANEEGVGWEDVSSSTTASHSHSREWPKTRNRTVLNWMRMGGGGGEIRIATP